MHDLPFSSSGRRRPAILPRRLARPGTSNSSAPLSRLLGRAALLVCLAAGAATPAAAGPVVIFDSGATVPVGHYFSVFFAPDPDPSPPGAPPAGPQLAISFPVRTPGMSPGILATPARLAAGAWLPAPMFLIGSDAASRAWLLEHRERLLRIHAAGLVVHADSLDDLRALQALAPGVPMAPGSAQGIAPQLGLTVYPLLITPDGTVTQRVAR